MENQNNYRFRFFKIVIYSLLLLSIIALVFIIFAGFNLNQFTQTHPGLVVHKTLPMEYLPILYVFILIIDLILILYRKTWAFYIFYLWIITMFFLLFIQDEKDWINAIIMIFLLVIFASAHSKMHRVKKKLYEINENLE